MARYLFGDFGLYRVFSFDLDRSAPPPVEPGAKGWRFAEVTGEEVERAKAPEISREAWYGGADSRGFAIFVEGQIVALQWFWFGERYKNDYGFWPLREDEAESRQLVTVPAMRGKGLATALKALSAHAMRERGFTRLISRVWHNNHASIAVNHKDGWREIAIVIEVRPLNRGRIRQWILRRRPVD
ncbi:MAG: GNAT family N-acetyltransferase [Alphaproteobacteria bacterium]